MTNILITGGTLLDPGPAGLDETPDGYLFIADGHIAALGAGAPPAELAAQAGRTIDAHQMAVLPGLVNGHTHLSQTFLRGMASDRPLLRWLKEVIWPAQAAMTPDDMYLAALLGLVENLRCGATTVVQHHKLPGHDHVDAAARAAAIAGVRMLLARGWVDLGASGEPLAQIMGELAWLYETWHGAAGGGIRVASGPMAPWRCSDETMRRTVAFARERGLATHIHVAETQAEIDLLLARCGQRHVEWLASLDCLGPDTQLVHSVHLNEAELDLVAGANATVVYCPTSNMFLASGAAPIPAMRARGIPVALGTDGPASNDSQDILECAKIGILLVKHAAGDAQALVPADMLAMLTSGGTRLWARGTAFDALGGRLQVSAPADIVLVDLNNARCQPVHNAASALVYCASGPDVHTVIVDGQILLDAGRITVLDEAGLLTECREAASRMLQRAGINT